MDAEDLALVFCRKEGTEDRQWFVLLPSIGKASYSTSSTCSVLRTISSKYILFYLRY